MVTVATRRIARLEQTATARYWQRWRAAERTLFESMIPQHRNVLGAWNELPDVHHLYEASPSGIPYAVVLARLDPPAIVRAAFEMIAWAADTGAPLHLRPELAQVYLDDPDAWARDVCAACGFLWPIRARHLGQGRLTVLGTYTDHCQECGSGEVGHFDRERFLDLQPDARR